jgi:hypothetical protein
MNPLDEEESERVLPLGKAGLSIRTDEEINAYIDVDGVYSGQRTPAALTLDAGEHVIDLYKKGFAGQRFTVNLRADEFVRRVVVMEDATSDPAVEAAGTYSFSTSPDRAAIFIDGIFQGKTTPAVLYIPDGTHELTYRKVGRRDVTKPIRVFVDVEGFDHTNLPEEVEVKRPIILVTTNPEGAKVFIDTLPTGKRTPQYFRIDAGVHTIRVVKEGFSPASAQITVTEV